MLPLQRLTQQSALGDALRFTPGRLMLFHSQSRSRIYKTDFVARPGLTTVNCLVTGCSSNVADCCVTKLEIERLTLQQAGSHFPRNLVTGIVRERQGCIIRIDNQAEPCPPLDWGD
jgi:hypothetical protein